MFVRSPFRPVLVCLHLSGLGLSQVSFRLLRRTDGALNISFSLYKGSFIQYPNVRFPSWVSHDPLRPLPRPQPLITGTRLTRGQDQTSLG